MPFPYLTDEANFADLISRIPGADREEFIGFHHLQVVPAFDRRILIVFKNPTGQSCRGANELKPRILTTIKVLSWSLDSVNGGRCNILDQGTGCRMTVTYVPHRLFDYDAFISLPHSFKVQWGARIHATGIDRNLTYPLLIKTRNNQDHCSDDDTHVVTPNQFREIFPEYPLHLNQA